MTLKNAAELSLVDLKNCLTQLDTISYTKPLQVYSGSTIGQHTRHIIEFYQCLLSQSETGVINYDKRIRNLNLETNIPYTIQSIDTIIERLYKEEFREDLSLESCYDTDNKEEFNIVSTNFTRELVYNIEHTIHHLAIIKIGVIIEAPHVKLPAGFGVAPSTTRYKNTVCVQ